MSLAQFGVEGDALPLHVEVQHYPKPVIGRTAHVDADFVAYQMSAETRDELDGIRPRKSFEDMCQKAQSYMEHIMRCAGATKYVAHLTPSASTKGGRHSQAVQQEYQGNREGRIRPEFLDELRAYIGRELNGVPHLDQEADDGMAQVAYNEDRHLNVICSKDKDLLMVPGLHLDMDSLGDTDGPKLIEVPHTGVGEVWFDTEKTQKGKVTGYGPLWFFMQCLMGDGADHIRGIPGITGFTNMKSQPTKDWTKWLAIVEIGETHKSYSKALEKIQERGCKLDKCGGMTALRLLDGVPTIKDAFHLVREEFQRVERLCGYQYTHWQTGAPVTPTQALLGDAQLLWMRRNKNPNDVVDWIKENV